ncbi:hypothetical protein PYCCODRAFT_1357714 [Trametes coccinea BRFM310]|uniref:Uncharacterized protein n=1 Tax=Trametes coccinea (strain BRFM310) TaxID=1353009 RepID=A0A1Y2J3H8_TRAC3|nr:hypothetical protein PYCCODRAFT_1357714 [Trametes coccinea BRFM310]
MQSKLNLFGDYCAVNCLTANVPKTLASVHGPLPDSLPLLRLADRFLTYVSVATYVGMTFSTTAADMFHAHYDAKVTTARRVAGAALALHSYVGSIPPLIALCLYRARVEPHLTAGCEVALDVHNRCLSDLVAVQHLFLRRALHLSAHAQLLPLFTETGLWPLRYRRYHLALRYLLYILTDRPALPLAAFRHAWALATTRAAPTWWSDLHLVGCSLPAPCALPFSQFPTPELVQAAIIALPGSLLHDLATQIARSQRLPLLHARLTYLYRHGPPPALSSLCATRAYLSLPTHRQRDALVRLVCSAHPLAVEALRHCRATSVPRADRLCRFCATPGFVEDEVHALLECGDPRLASLRLQFLEKAALVHPGIPHLHFRLPGIAFLDLLLGTENVLPLFGDYVADIFALCLSTPHPLTPAPSSSAPP